jgi:hypothetical protein
LKHKNEKKKRKITKSWRLAQDWLSLAQKPQMVAP